MIVDNYKVQDQTSAIEKVETIPSLISSMGFFRDTPVASDSITFDVRENTLSVLDDSKRNTRTTNTMDSRDFAMHTLAIPHYSIEESIGRNQLAGIRGFGKETEKAINMKVAEELVRQSERHDNHEEYLKALMLFKGQVDTNYHGLIDVATEFGVAQQTYTFLPNDPIANQLLTMTRKAKDGLKTGSRARGYVLFAGVTLFAQIMDNDDVKAAFSGASYGNNPLLNELGVAGAGYTMFRMGNVDIVLYDDEFTTPDGTVVKPVGDAEGVLVPRAELGEAFFGPVSKLSGVGTLGAKRFASSYRDPKDRYIDVDSEQNTLVVNKHFGATVKITL